MRISDWSSDVCSSDLIAPAQERTGRTGRRRVSQCGLAVPAPRGPELQKKRCSPLNRPGRTWPASAGAGRHGKDVSNRSEEHTSELQSLMRISYADFCLKKKKTRTTYQTSHDTI